MDEQVERNLQLQAFIAKDVKRYCDVFEKNKDKDIFIHTNWAAFFFGPAWMFYRSMWLWGTAVLAIQYFILFLAAIVFALLYMPEIAAAGYVITDDIMMNIMLGAIVVLLVARLGFSLFADCLYRAFVRKNLGTQEGGVSLVAGVVVASFISGILGEVISYALSAIIILIGGS